MKKIISMFLTFVMCFSVMLISTNTLNVSAEETPSLVKTVEGGQIQGYLNDTSDVQIYKGIPYAAPPTGNNRWKAPQDVIAWDGIKSCTTWGPSAIQAEQAANGAFSDEFIISNKTYSEDCLTLNVWTKNDTVTNKPVLVFIHGGGWTAGGSSCEIYDGEYVASQDVIFVSVNYRLGIFGWYASNELAAEDPEGSTGNYGLMDIIKSLEWIKENISVFGGNPNNVTIMGQSAGANLVNTLMVSPKATGLFHNAVSMSFNNMNNAFASGTDRKNSGDDLGSLADLRLKTSEEIKAMSWLSLGPCIDGVYVTQNYQDGLENGMSHNINLMTGMVDNDANTSIENSSFDYGMGLGLALLFPVSNATFGECLMGLQNCIAKARALASENNISVTGKTYIYRFSHIMPGETNCGAFHSSDIPYFLNYFSPLRASYWTNVDYTVGQNASGYLINFCKTGNPNGEGLVVWNESTGNYTYFEIKETCEEKSLTTEQIDSIKSKFTGFFYGHEERYF